MAKKINGILLRKLFQLEEEDNCDKSLNQLLSEKLKEIKVLSNNKIELTFENGVIVIVSSDFESYRIYISEPRLYKDEDSSDKLISQDRVLYYLKRIARFKYKVGE